MAGVRSAAAVLLVVVLLCVLSLSTRRAAGAAVKLSADDLDAVRHDTHVWVVLFYSPIDTLSQEFAKRWEALVERFERSPLKVKMGALSVAFGDDEVDKRFARDHLLNLSHGVPIVRLFSVASSSKDWHRIGNLVSVKNARKPDELLSVGQVQSNIEMQLEANAVDADGGYLKRQNEFVYPRKYN